MKLKGLSDKSMRRIANKVNAQLGGYDAEYTEADRLFDELIGGQDYSADIADVHNIIYEFYNNPRARIRRYKDLFGGDNFVNQEEWEKFDDLVRRDFDESEKGLG